MKTYPPLNLKPKIDLGMISSKNCLLEDKLVSLVYKTIRLVIKTSSKAQEPKTYDKVINNLFYGSR